MYDTRPNTWGPKNDISSFYPMHWSQRRIQMEVLEAMPFGVQVKKGSDLWEAVTPSGVLIRWFVKDGKTDSVYSIHADWK